MRINLIERKKKIHSESENDISVQKTDILDHIEKIVEVSKEIGIEKCFNNRKLKKSLDFVSVKLGLNPIQTILFSHFLDKNYDSRINVNEIAESVKCSNIRIIKYIKECDALEKKKLIRCSRDNGDETYRVPYNVKESLRKFNEFKPESRENLDITKFFTVLEKMFEERASNEYTFKTLTIELIDLIKINMHLEFCRKIMSYKLHNNDLTLLVCFCHLFGNNNDDNIGSRDFEFLFNDNSECNHVKKKLSNAEHVLIEAKLIEFTNDNGYINSTSWKLSDRAKKELISELNIKGNQSFKKNLIKFETISYKKMFYNVKETEAVDKLTTLLKEDNYGKIMERLDGKGMRKGFACLFSGGPGTGKTETAYQIARETKRDIMKVDISEIKSCWYGESEKKIKAIFDNYREAVLNSEIAPILLFNEADAVIGKRKEFSAGSRAIDQTENTIQNIILEEIEKLSGILIATTNLVQNMDSAFERRFLYKINFDKPTAQSRKGIWSALLPDITADAALELSEKYELSGGQIENIARKTEVDSIIDGNALSMETLLQYCKDETMNSFTNMSKKIGF